MTDKEIMKLAKDIVMYFDGLEMCGETADVLVEQIMETFFALKEGRNCDIWWALDDRLTELLAEKEDEPNRAYKNLLGLEIMAVKALKDRLGEII